MIEDMRIRGLGDKSQQAHIRAVKDFAGFLKRSPDTATTEELHSYQLHMTDNGVTPLGDFDNNYLYGPVIDAIERMEDGKY